MKGKYNIVIRVPNFNDGKNKYALCISEDQLIIFAEAVNSNNDFALINGIKFKTKEPELVKIYKIKSAYDSWTDDQIKQEMDREKRLYRGKVNTPVLRKFGDEVTGQFIKSKTTTKIESLWANIHPVIISVSKDKFEDEYYADSVESAFKEINDLIKKEYRSRTGAELDGSALMKNSFSLNNPAFSLADLSTDSGRKIQLGYMEIFSGAITGIRNPKAHANLEISEVEAWEKLVLASHLMKMWDSRVNK